MTEKFSSTTNLDLIIANNDTKQSPVNGENRKKKRGSFNLLRTTLFMLRPGSNRKPNPVQLEAAKASNGNWKTIVGSIRPLHLPDHPSPPSSVTAELAPTVEQFEESMIAPASPSPSSSSGGTMSQYASANNLQELNNHDESDEEDPDDVFDTIGSDEMIDSKAEMFIAQFYHQMRLQNLDSANRRNRRVSH